MTPGPPDTGRAWHTLADDQIREALETGPRGLDPDEVARRLTQFGPNEVRAAEETRWWKVLLHQFRDPLIYILVVAAGVTLALRDYTDAAVILAVVLINAVIGFWQEMRAQQAIRSLARLSAPRAQVVRGGTAREIASRELVPGDVVLLGSGSLVPADVRLFRVHDLEVDESALTGESVPVRKTVEPLEAENLVPGDRTNMAFLGTAATRGRGRGYVARTGGDTELGRIASAVHEIGHTATPLQLKMARLGKQVGLVILGLSSVVLVIGLLRGMSAAEIFLAAVAMAVSAIPEGLPVVLTVTLAVGVRRMAGRRAIIRFLPAVETLGSTTVIGSDKTGTLTKNEMTVRAVWAGGRLYEVTGAGYALEGEVRVDGERADPEAEPVLRQTLLAGALANEADAPSVAAGAPQGDPTEVALLVAAGKAGIPLEGLRDASCEVDLLPFEPERRLMATLNELPEGRRLLVKGAPETILARSARQRLPDGDGPLDRDAVSDAARRMGAQGLRVLAMAERPLEEDRIREDALTDLVFLGLVGMEDPVRPEAVASVAAARDAGIRVLMLTGDHLDTARAVGDQLGLDGGRAVEGHELDALSDGELDRVLADVDVFARVAPEHKLRITQRLKARGEVVAVTGDGVNDAPALAAAHLGIAMGKSGTDVAREASDMVLADDNFATITAAVEEGRIVFSNLRKVTFFLLSTAVGEIIAITLAVAAGWPLPFVAAQILWINLVTNGLQDVALAFEPGEPDLLSRPPRPAAEGVITRRVLGRLGAVGVVLAAGTLGVFWWTLDATSDLDMARTAAMTQMVVFQFFHVFNCRSLDRSIVRIPLLSNRLLFVSILAAAAAHLAALHLPPLQALLRTVPLDSGQWLVILLVGSTAVLGGELDKWWNRHEHRPIG